MKSSVERQSEILELLQQAGSQRVEILAKHFQVSSVTIRNDLNVLEKQGLITRSYGVAVLNAYLNKELSISDKDTKFPERKAKIGKLAASLLKDGEKVIFDSGTTTKAIVNHLGELDIVAMTNGLDIAMALSACPNVEVRISGGTLRKNAMSFSGLMANENLRQYRFDKVFLGVDGFDLKRGITTFNEQEGYLNRLMTEIADQVIVVTDSSKFGQYSEFVICAADEIDILVTDNQIPSHYRQQLESLGVKVLVAE
ncbi:transcriptional regulator [Pasteurellaceae bacterium RH1A]|nr:transcriptional regulator [Pasteurellaceae bacterium RH1A]